MHTAAYKYETQQKYIDKTETKQKLKSTMRSQLSSPFTIKNGINAFKYTASQRTGFYTRRTLETSNFKRANIQTNLLADNMADFFPFS